MAHLKVQGFWLAAVVALMACDDDRQAAEKQPEPPEVTPEKLEKAEHEHPAPNSAAAAADMPAVPEGAKVFFISPKVADRIEGPLVDGKVEVPVVMGTEGIAVKPAGEVEAGTGHHHVLIDLAPVPAGEVVVKDDSHIHFGGGQTEATVPVRPGQHTLTLQFADGLHRSYGSELSSSITIEVAASDKKAATH